MSSRSRSGRKTSPRHLRAPACDKSGAELDHRARSAGSAASSSFIEDSVKPGMSKKSPDISRYRKGLRPMGPPALIAPPPDMNIQLFSMGDAPFIGRAGTRLLESVVSSIVCCFKITAHRQCARSSACSEARPRTRWTVFHAMKPVRESVSANQMHCLEMFGVDLQDCNEIDG